MAGKTLRAVDYDRVSTDEEKQLNALEKQIQESKDTIVENGWYHVDSYIDEGKSGTTVKRRGEYQRLLEDMTLDKFDIIVVKDQDRLQRNTRDWYLFVDRLITHNLQLYFYLDKKFFTPNDDTLITGIKAILAEEYSRNLSKKLNNSNRRRVEKAKNGGEVSAMGNGKSLGYAIKDTKWIQVPSEIEVCKLIWDLYEKYDSLRKVRDEINNRGYTNSVGKPFTTESISRILKNEKSKGVIVLGQYHHEFNLKKIIKMPEDTWVRIPAPELAYVTEERFEKVQARLQAKTGKGRGKNVGRDALSGKLFCSKCGAVLWRRESGRTNKNGEQKKYYHWECSNRFAKGDIACTGVRTTTVKVKDAYAIISKDIEINKKAVKASILEWLNKLKTDLSTQSNSEAILSDIKRLERQKDKLTEAYLEDIISKDDYKAKYAGIDSKLEKLQALLTPVEENKDIIEIEKVIKNIDKEIDEYIGTLDFEESKIEFLLEHTKKVTVLENKDIGIELDLLAGAIIAGKNFVLYVNKSVPYCVHTTKGFTIKLKIIT